VQRIPRIRQQQGRGAYRKQVRSHVVAEDSAVDRGIRAGQIGAQRRPGDAREALRIDARPLADTAEGLSEVPAVRAQR